MAEIKKITTLYVVTDTETGQEKIGDIDGGCFPIDFLEKHIRAYGAQGLLEKLAYMTSAVVRAKYSVDCEKSDQRNKIART